jgi:hypothetical protein
MRLTLCLLVSTAYIGVAITAKSRPQVSDPDLGKNWPTFYEGSVKGTKHVCVEISALRPPPKNPPNPGFYSLRYRLHASQKAITRIDLDRTNLWRATAGPSDYLAGAGRVSAGKHDLSVSVKGLVDSVRIQLIMQSNMSTGEVVADVNECKPRE